jgi:tRNA modification GTPase
LVEINCHGNLFIVNNILNLILNQGASLAEPGEFSKRAFFNGKINLIQAQAINDLIQAPNLSAVKLALHNLTLQAQEELNKLEADLLEIIATVEVNINYPEYDGAEYLTGKKILPHLQNLKKKLKKILSEGKQAKIYQEGVKVAIVGKPNVGKSTLLNTLLQEEKAIVSPLAGTTRDVIEGKYNLKGIPLILFDTAGIRSTENVVEKIGVARSKKVLEQVELIFFLLDNSQPWSLEDSQIWNIVKNKKTIVIVNKTDLEKKLVLPKDIFSLNTVLINAKAGKIQELEHKIKKLLTNDLEKIHSPYPFLSQSWQQSKLNEIIKKIRETTLALQKEIPLDIISEDLQLILHLLQELSGKDYHPDLLEIIFSKFCLGK